MTLVHIVNSTDFLSQKEKSERHFVINKVLEIDETLNAGALSFSNILK